MMFKVVLIIAVFGVVVNSFSLPRSGKGLENDEEYVIDIKYGRQDGQKRQWEQDNQGGHGWLEQQNGRKVSGGLYRNEGQGSSVGYEGYDDQVVRREEVRNDGRVVYGRQSVQSGNRNYLSSLESSSSESSEIQTAQKQYHDTNPENARNGRMVPNQMRPRHHKAFNFDFEDQGESINKVYKDV